MLGTLFCIPMKCPWQHYVCIASSRSGSTAKTLAIIQGGSCWQNPWTLFDSVICHSVPFSSFDTCHISSCFAFCSFLTIAHESRWCFVAHLHKAINCQHADFCNFILVQLLLLESPNLESQPHAKNSVVAFHRLSAAWQKRCAV